MSVSGTASSTWRFIGAFCGRQTLQGLLERMDPPDAGRAEASLPFLLSIRWLQDISYSINRGGDDELVDRCLHRLREHLEKADPTCC